MKRYKILGINDDQEHCDLCGKKHLKQVVWIEDQESFQVFATGTTCAAKLQKISVKDQKALEKQFEIDRKASIKAEIKPYQKAYDEVVRNAPSTSFDANHKASLKDRLVFIDNHPDTISYNAKRKEMSEKYGVEIWKISY
jgi:hypothetical protein